MAKSRLLDTRDFTSVAFATTSYDDTGEIIEIAMVRFRNGEVQAIKSDLIESSGPVPAEVTKYTGITNEMIKGKPRAAQVAESYIEFLGNDVVVAQETTFVTRFLKKLVGYELRDQIIETKLASSKYYEKEKKHTLPAIANRLMIEGILLPEIDHRAESTARVTGIIYTTLLPRLLEKSDGDLAQLEKNRRVYLGGKLVKIDYDEDEIPDDATLEGKCICMTGNFLGGKRENLMKLAIEKGAIKNSSVTRKTDYLVIGGEGFYDNKKGGEKSKKILDAEAKRDSTGKPLIVLEKSFVDTFDLDWNI